MQPNSSTLACTLRALRIYDLATTGVINGERITFEQLWISLKEQEGLVLEARRPERFVFQWHPDNTVYATTVEINFESSDDGTVIRLREYGYQDIPSGHKAMLGCAAGWGEALTLLKFYVEHGIRY